MYGKNESMLELTRFIIEKTDVQTSDARTSDECELDDELIRLTEKLIAHYAAPKHKFLNYLYGMVYLELTKIAGEAEPVRNPNLRLILCKPAEVDNG